MIKGITQISVKEDPKPGAIYLPRGEWRSEATYTRTDEVIHFVYYNGYAYEVLKPIQPGGNDPYDDVKENGGNWKSMGKYDVIATQVLLANFAILAGGVFWNGRLMSQQGTDNSGNPTDDFTQYTENSAGVETGAFHPNLLINFVSGYLKCVNTRIESNVSGNKIVLDPSARKLQMINSNNTVVFELSFEQSYSQMRLVSTLFNLLISPDGVTFSRRSDPTIQGNFGINSMAIKYSETNFIDMNVANGYTRVQIRGLPTSSSGLASGFLWRDGNTVKIVP